MGFEVEEKSDIFSNGAIWIRADFHLHTRADKEFTYDGEDDYYNSNYIHALKGAGIRLGVVTNHNKFNRDEFKALRSTAKKAQIYLLPGVELSVNDGANGVHMLIVFSKDWIQDNDYISPFISSMFPGKAESEYQNENGRSDKNILQVVEELNKTSRDFFIIFAHVEESKGLWEEMSGGKISDFSTSRYDGVREKTLAFQKVRTRDTKTSIKQALGNWYPAEVEGSDPKSIEEIGRGKKCYIKLGAFSFDAVKYALIDHEHRIASTIPQYTHSYITSIDFLGGTLDRKTIRFSPELNTLIGIRGSGKSSIIELLRYVLDLPLGDKAGDSDYKKKLVQFTMGSGGKAVIHAVDRFGQPYQVSRILNENPIVRFNNELSPGISIRETVLHHPIYYGQKDLANRGEGFENDLIEKLVGTKLDDVRKRISEQSKIVNDTVGRLLKINNTTDQIEELEKTKADTEHRLKVYSEKGLEEKLQKRLDFDNDVRSMDRGIALIDALVNGLREILSEEDGLRDFGNGEEQKYNSQRFVEFFAEYKKIFDILDGIKEQLIDVEHIKVALSDKKSALTSLRQELADEFAEIERNLSVELKDNKKIPISPDEFIKLKDKLAVTVQSLNLLSKQGDLKQKVSDELEKELAVLNGLWHEEFTTMQSIISSIFDEESKLQVCCEYKGNKAAFLNYMKSVFKGTGIREITYKEIVDSYPDFIAIYLEPDKNKKVFGSNPALFMNEFMENLQSLLTYQVSNGFSITYHGKELRRHSLGQRASALMLFVLSQKDNDVIIIDQPEDDLDNQTIYEDVIKLIKKLKPQIQFIFATHNPNIPVLGDAEQIHTCSFEDDKVSLSSGSIDNALIQKNIVDIMEGGKEAFDKRKEIYQIWKS